MEVARVEEVTAAVVRAAGAVTTTGAAWVAARVAAVTEVMVTGRRGEKAGNRRQIKDWGRATLVCSWVCWDRPVGARAPCVPYHSSEELPSINRPGSHARPKRRSLSHT